MSPTPEELYIANEKLARKCLLRFFPALANDEDVLQTARMALWRACQDFKPGKWQLSTLAYTYIRRDIIKETVPLPAVEFQPARQQLRGFGVGREHERETGSVQAN